MKLLPSFLLYCLIAMLGSCTSQKKEISLAGTWNFQIDRLDTGEAEKWYTNELKGKIELPGSMAENNLGDDISLETEWMGTVKNSLWYEDPNYAPYHDPENIRFPYWLQPLKKYTGAAWYQKEVNIPASWGPGPIELSLERVHWESTLWFDNQKAGMQNSLGTSHVYIIQGPVEPGKHLISIRVDNRMKEVDVGWNSHSVTDHTQSNWHGIAGELKISPLPEVSIGPVRIFSDTDNKTIKIKGKILNLGQEGRKAKVSSKVKGPGIRDKIDHFELNLSPGESDFELEIAPGEKIMLWDEFDTNLYTLDLELRTGKETCHLSETFGFREVEAGPEGLSINDRPLFLRGTLECAIFPLTAYPPVDPDEWRRIFRVIKSHGLNHMRFHSWCPPEAAFIAADEMGVYLQVECSSWANSETTSLGDGLPIDKYILEESRRIIDSYGNHPSFIMMAYGNEPGGRNQNQYLDDFVSFWKKNDPRRLYTSGAGWPMLPVNDYHNIPGPRIQRWGEQLNSIINSKPPSSAYDWSERLPEGGIPVVSHEIGQWCVYPDFKEITEYTGVLKARNFEIFEESLKDHGMGELADSFLLASGKLQALCYKADIEAALRTPAFGGFQLLDLHDFPGQGTALIGILNPFWDEKGYISPEEFSMFCNSVVPLARLEKHIFTEEETMEVPIQVAWYDKAEGIRQKAEVRLKTKENEIISSLSWENLNIPIGNENYIGIFRHTFEQTGNPRQLILETSIGEYTNSCNIWVYPESPESQIPNPQSPRIITDLSDENIIHIMNGGSALLSLGKGKVAVEYGGDVGVGFSSIFWNTAWTDGQKPHTLGILCDPGHPALSLFPTEFHSSWQWWDAMAHADAINLEKLGTNIKPVVRIIDDWVTNRPLGLIIEAKVGEGKLIISGADLHTDIENRPAARQLRTSLLNYMGSDKFSPDVSISPATLIKSIKPN